MNQRDLHTLYLGKKTALTGASAIQILESAISECIPAIPHGVHRNIFGRPLIEQQDHFKGIAFAMGLSSSGLRAHTTIYGNEILSEKYPLSESARRHLAYVIHLYTQKRDRDGLSQDADHRCFHAASNSGCIQFFASDNQDAVDLTILGHKISEQSLCPVIIAMDHALSSAEQVMLPEQNVLKVFLGQNDDFIESPTPAQKMIFGKSRRRIPNWFHFDFPVIQGVEKKGQAQSFELAAQQAYFGSHAEPITEQIFKEFENLTGRSCPSIASYKADDAEYVILAQGSSYTRVASVVDYFRSKKIKAGAMHLRVVRPFPAEEVCRLLSGKKGLTILERVSQPLDSEPPIFRDIVSALGKAVQNRGKKKTPVFPNFPALSEREKPVMYSGQYGTNPSSLTNADIIRVFENMINEGQRRFFVDINFTRAASSFPKQHILLQNIKRDYPEIDRLSLGGSKTTGIPSDHTYTFQWSLSNAAQVSGALLENISGLISRRWNCRVSARKMNDREFNVPAYQLSISRQPWPYPIDKDTDVDVFITDTTGLRTLSGLEGLKKEAHVVIIASQDNEPIFLPRIVAERIQQMNFKLFLLPKAPEWDELIMGSVLVHTPIFFGEKPDTVKELAEAEKFFKESKGHVLTDAQKAAITQGLTEIKEIKDTSIFQPEDTEPAELPLALRKYEDHGPPYSRVSQFYDRTGVFYETGAMDEIVADPFQGIPVAPAATANFTNNANLREMVPEFSSTHCTGCGKCSVYCPESAIPPIVISAESFVTSAVNLAQAAGAPMTQWTPPVVKNFAKLINQALSSVPENMTTLGGILPDILKKLAAQMKIEGERLQTLRDQSNMLMPALNDMPVAVTTTFFSDLERQAKGSGSLFSVVVNPQSCTGCGVCADVCPENALVMSQQDHERSARLQSQFRLWEQLPDTPADIIQKMVQDKSYDPFAAILLSRNYYMSMAGGSGSKTSMPEKMIIHLVAAVGESATQSKTNKQIREIEQRIKSLTEKIQNKLREALPTDNFDNLMSSLSGSENARVSLDTVIKKLSETQRFGVVETAWMERIVSLIHDLKSLAWTLSKGPTGAGRSRFGAVLSGEDGLDWAKQFPYNAFISPVVIYDSPDSMSFILGLCQGHIRQMIDNVKLLRRADLEMQNQYDPIVHDEEISNLSWNELTEDEKNFIPPLFVLTDHKMTSNANLPSLLGLLSSDFPVKVFLFDTVAGNAEYWRNRMAITTAVMSLRNCFMFQSSMAKPDHMFKGLLDGLHHPTPGFFRLMIPEAQNITADVSRIALITRAFPLFRFDPSVQKNTFSTALDLSANPEPYEEYVITKNEQGNHSVNYIMTFADWAFLQPNLKNHFSLMDDKERRGVGVSEYIAMAPNMRSDKIPFILGAEGEDRPVKYAVSETIAKAAEAAHAAWNTLREIAGMLTPYPQKLKERIDEEWSLKHAAEMEQLKSDYEEKLRQQESKQLEQVKQKLSDKLMALSGYSNKS